jgi:propanediol dehydratase large subunit
VDRFAFCCNVKPLEDDTGHEMVTLLAEWVSVSGGAPAVCTDGNETPETAGQGIIAAGHRAAGIRLADGAGDLIGRAGAGAAAAGDFIPVME